jgi:predicted TIM-barrel fold metal-dependent hydrolase
VHAKQPAPLDSSPERLAREERRRARGLLDGVVDSHVHPFPAGFLRALRQWFDAHAWRFHFRGDAEECLDVLERAGVSTVVALVYAHKAGAASFLNAYVGELARAHAFVVPVGTVLPGEPDARRTVREAVSRHGVRGIKLHCHVQAMAIDDPRVVEVLSECAELGVPAIVHAGREPRSPGYAVDPHALCSAARTRNVLRALPRLRLVVPHLGYDEIDAYIGLLGEHENLYLDTTMVCAEYFDARPDLATLERHADRIMYGSDFPITPYEADRELVALARSAISDEAFERITRTTARAFWGLGAGSGR